MTRAGLVVIFALDAAACGFGHQLERPDGLTLVENLGGNRYVYHSTPLIRAQARGAATPAIAITPAGAQNIGLIEVSIERLWHDGFHALVGGTTVIPILGDTSLGRLLQPGGRR